MSELENVSGESAAPTSSAAPAEATPSAPAAPTATPQAAPASATPSIPDGYVPSYRLRETRETAERSFAQREAEMNARYGELERKWNALVGITPPADPEVETVRQQFARLYPGLAKLEDRANDLMGVVDKAGDLESQTSHYWQSYGRQSVDRLFSAAEASLGTPLSAEGKRVLHSSFTGFVSQSPELIERYANDPTLVEEFVKMFTSSFIDPARRAASATVVGRAPGALPQDTPGGAPRGTPAPKLEDSQRGDAAWALYQKLAK